ncbi:MAG: hypothetical protein JWL83_3825, partial [Actinomycetia bacterium]|nr:hypothetical protein [Actinomycetes bacterium]
IGMANSQVAVIDPATKRVAHVDDIGDSTTELAGRIVAISPYRATATSWNAWVTRGDGTNMVLLPNGKTIRPGTLPVAPDATTTTASGDLLYVVAGNELAIRSSKHDTVGVARYDSSTSTFSDVVASTGNAVATPGGFDYVISAGGSIWVKFGDSPGGEVLLIRPR